MLYRVLLVSAVGVAQASYDTIASYIPGSQVTDHNAIDLDQDALEITIQDSSNANRFPEGYAIYNEGGNSRPQVTLTLSAATTQVYASGTPLYQWVNGALRAISTRGSTASGSTTIGPMRYPISDVQATHSPCRGAGAPLSSASLPTTTANDPVNPVLTGCLGTGNICVAPTLVPRTQAEVTACDGGQSFTVSGAVHNAGRTIRGFTGAAGSTGASYPGLRSMAPTTPSYSCPGCPYKDFLMFYNYYGDLAYGDTIVRAAFGNLFSATQWAGVNVVWPTGSVAASNFPVTMTDQADSTRTQVIKKGTVYLTILMYAIREFEDAIDDCSVGQITNNDEPVHAWDEGVAFYTGSMEGESGTRARGVSPAGILSWNLADYRCQNFHTCTGADSISGLSRVNTNLLRLFALGQTTLQRGECADVRPIVEDLIDQTRIPLIQGTLRYTYRIANLMANTINHVWYAEGGIFAAAIVPVVHHCSAAAAATIAANINLGTTIKVNGGTSTNFTAVKLAFESVYSCMNLTCADVGGFWNAGSSAYYTGATPCSDPVTPRVSFDVVASGDVADYTPTVLDGMATSVANTLTGVSRSAVTVTVAAGSVIVSVSITVADAAAQAALVTQVATQLASTTTAGTMLTRSLPAGSPTFTVTEIRSNPGAPVAATPGEDKMPTWAIAILAILGALFFLFFVAFCVMMQKEKAGKPIFVTKVRPTNA